MSIIFTEFLIHFSTVIALFIPLYFSYYVLKDIGGAIGNTFKYVIIGISLITFHHFAESLEYFNINILPPEESFSHLLIDHFTLIISFLLIGYGFYKLRNILKSHGT